MQPRRDSAGARLCPQDLSQRVDVDDVWKNLRLVSANVLRLVCDTAVSPGESGGERAAVQTLRDV